MTVLPFKTLTLFPDPEAYLNVINRFTMTSSAIVRIDRFSFYERAEKAFCCIITGSVFKYGNIILKKGVISS